MTPKGRPGSHYLTAIPRSSCRPKHGYEPDWLVACVDEAVDIVASGGGAVIAPPSDIPVGRVAVVADPLGNVLVLLDSSKGRYTTDESGSVTGVSPDLPAPNTTRSRR